MTDTMPAYAVVELRCNPDKFGPLQSIPNLKIIAKPIRTDDPTVAVIGVLADSGAQDAARGLGCEVTVVKSAEAYRHQIEDAYRGLGETPGSDQRR